MKELQAVNKYLWRYKWVLLLGLLFTALSNYLGSLAPEVVGQAIDFASNGKALKFGGYFHSGTDVHAGIRLAVFVIIGLTLLSGFFLYLMRKTIIVTSHKIVADLRNDLYDHYQDLDQLFYKRNSTGDMMSRLTEDISNVRMYVGPALMYFANTIAMFVFYIYQMIKADAMLTFWTLLPLPFLSFSIYVVSSIIFKKTNAIQTKLSALTSFAQEAYSGIRVIKSYAREDSFSESFNDNSEEYRSMSISLAKVEAIFFPLMLLLIGTSTIIAIYVGGLHIEKGIIEAGTIVQFLIYVGKLTWPVTSLGWIASIVQKAAASQRRINNYMAQEPNITSPNQAQEVSNNSQTIEFRNVSFTYPDTGIQALKNVSFTINTGERVAIIGRTGSGKSTLADLIFRVFDPQEGQILINGVDIKNIDLKELRQSIGYVPQDVFLFSDTIEKNINLSSRLANLSEIKDAAVTASVDKEIERFPKGYQTMIGERGVMLSGGQKQRISIARAILRHPNYLILDDALSAVDAETEQVILEEFNALFEDKTVLIITHRIFTLFDVDKILVLENGKLAQNGTHQVLINQDGIYKELYELQDSDDEH